MRSLIGLCCGLFCALLALSLHAEEPASVPLTVDVTHVGKDQWRVDYRFARPVTAITLSQVGDYRQRAWKVRTPGLQLTNADATDTISAGGKPFKTASVDITTFDGVLPKDYASFNRFTDGGTAIFLGHLQGDARQDQRTLAMHTDFRLHGLAQETVIAPPQNRQQPGGVRGYAYFGPGQAITAGSTRFLLDPAIPGWARETMQDTGDKMARYYEQAYQRPLRGGVFIMASVAGFEAPGISMKGGAVMGQLSYRFEGKAMLGDSQKKRDLLARIVAHEMAHLWQLNTDRGGIGENDPWIHEGGAEAMALDGLLQTGVLSPETVSAYRQTQSATCDKLGNTVDSYDGIYACGLTRFDRLGVPVVPLWRALIDAAEAKGEAYSAPMIEAVVATAKSGAAPTPAAPARPPG